MSKKMSILKLNPEEYKRTIAMSRERHLLVEGKQDKQFFRLFWNKFYPDLQIFIDSAESFLSFTSQTGEAVVGNRKIVEEISNSITSRDYAYKFVGFVDREFREFDLNKLSDQIRCHKVCERLVWSRGHSIENYFFESLILNESLTDLSDVEFFDKAIKVLQKHLEKIIRIACAMGLVGRELEKLRLIRESIHWKNFEFVGVDISFKVDEWNQSLRRKKVTDEMILEMTVCFETWFAKVDSSDIDFEVIRWLCDGHLGLSLIRAAYCFCVFSVTPNGDEDELVSKIYGIKEGVMVQNLASWWVRKAASKECIYPSEVFTLFGLNLC